MERTSSGVYCAWRARSSLLILAVREGKISRPRLAVAALVSHARPLVEPLPNCTKFGSSMPWPNIITSHAAWKPRSLSISVNCVNVV